MRRSGLIVVVLLVAAVIYADTKASLSPVHSDAGIHARYQLILNPTFRGDAFLLDTETGKIWTRTIITDIEGKPEIWKFQDRFDNDAQFLAWALKQQPVKAVAETK